VGYREVESVVRERPDVAMAAMRVLANRLAEASRQHGEVEQEV